MPKRDDIELEENKDVALPKERIVDAIFKTHGHIFMTNTSPSLTIEQVETFAFLEHSASLDIDRLRRGVVEFDVSNIQIPELQIDNINLRTLTDLVLSYPSLKIIKLDNCINLTNFNFKEASLLQLEEISIANHVTIADAKFNILDFKNITNAAPHLRAINLMGCKRLKDFDLEEGSLNILEEIDLSWCSKLTIDDFSNFIKAAPNLRMINLAGCKGLEKFNLKEGSLKALEELDLSWCRELTIDDFRNIIKAAPNLRIIGFSYCKELNGFNFKEDDLQKLQEIYLGDCDKLTSNDFVNILKAAPNLRKIAIKNDDALLNDKLKDIVLKSNSLLKLEELELHVCKSLTVDDLKSIFYAAPKLKKITLDYLDPLLNGFDLTNGCLKKLEELSFSGIRSIKVNDLENILKAAPNLKKVNLSGAWEASGFNIKKGSLGKLEEIWLSSFHELTSSDIKNISIAAPNLRVMDITFCANLKEFELDTKNLDSLETLRLGYCDSLKIIDFRNILNAARKLIEISFSGFAQLRNIDLEEGCLPELEEVRFYDCHNVTRDDIKNLMISAVNLRKIKSNLGDEELLGRIRREIASDKMVGIFTKPKNKDIEVLQDDKNKEVFKEELNNLDKDQLEQGLSFKTQFCGELTLSETADQIRHSEIFKEMKKFLELEFEGS